MPFPMDSSPSPLWTLHLDGKAASCDVRFVPIGIEVRVFRNGRLLYARTFPTGDEALLWAEEERVQLAERGWS